MKKTVIRDAEVCIIKDGQILRGVDVYGELCIMIVNPKLMIALAQESRRFRYDKKEKVLYLQVTGKGIQPIPSRPVAFRGLVMACDSPYGTKVVYDNPKNGTTADKRLAKDNLKLGNVYTVGGTVSGDFGTRVWFTEEEVLELEFNSVMFSHVSYPVGTVVGKNK